MNLNVLKNLAEAADRNENVLVNGSEDLKEEVREYVYTELAKICEEEDKLNDFILLNMKKIRVGDYADVFHTEYSDSFGGVGFFKAITLNHNYIYKNYGLSLGFTNEWWKGCNVPYLRAMDNCHKGWSFEYWCELKKMIDFRRWQLTRLCEEIEKHIRLYLDEQRERIGNVTKTCTEIDDEKRDYEVMDVRITIVRTK